MATLQEFIARVVPWPSSDEVGFINLHWTSPSGPGMRGRPFTKIADFLSMVAWANGHQKYTKDIYFCLSRQAEMGKAYNGKHSALRTKENAQAFAAIWTDIDVKDGSKGYASQGDALDALIQFLPKAGLPQPSALVSSGSGGLHVYWISDTPLAPDEWRRYAHGLKAAMLQHGLKADYGVTTDEARILRVPETYNFKSSPPNPVKLLRLGPSYSFAKDLSSLPTVPLPTSNNLKPISHPAFDNTKPILALEPEPFSGISEDKLVPHEPLIGQCAFFTEALNTGGKDYSQPMWNLTTLLSTFLENGHEVAHRLGNQHADYSRDSTDALWDRKEKERRDRGLGWPSCNAIQAAGCTACISCPHFGRIKSPLNLAAEYAPSPPEGESGVHQSDGSIPPGVTVAVTDADLPGKYRINSEGWISLIVKAEKKADVVVPLLQCRIFDLWPEGEPKYALHFVVETSKGITQRACIEMRDMGASQTLGRVLGQQGIKWNTECTGKVGKMFMDLLTKLHREQAAIKAVPYGWLQEDGKETGFAYAMKIYKPDGTTAPSGAGDAKTRFDYTPVGDIRSWIEAFNFCICGKGRPDLEVLVAASFAAPLMQFAGMAANSTLSARGNPGTGKSTACELGLAVWGHPVRTKQKPSATQKSVLNHIGQIRNLPVYWDDIRKEQADKVGSTLADLTHSGEGGRLNTNVQQRETGEWYTMLIVASNAVMSDIIVKKYPDDAAALYRIFEYHVPDQPEPGPSFTNHAIALMERVRSNYGGLGIKYAQTIAGDPEAIRKMVRSVADSFGARVGALRAERFWMYQCATIYVGAKIAQTLGVNFNTNEMLDFLVKQFKEQRKRIVTETVTGGSEAHAMSQITAFIKHMNGHIIRTHKMVTKRGHIKPEDVGFIDGPASDRLKEGIHVQWVIDENLLRLSRKEFNNWLLENKGMPTITWGGLTEHFKAYVMAGNLTAGLPYDGGREDLIVIPYEDGSDLYEMSRSVLPFEQRSVVQVMDKQDDVLAKAMEVAKKDAAVIHSDQ